MIKSIESIKLTKNQLKAVNSVKQFVQSDNDIFILTGAAGTGKTTVVKNIISETNEYVSDIILLAPTNRAVKILSKKSGVLAGTVHSEIYKIKDIKNKDGKIIYTKLVPRYLDVDYNEEEIEKLKTQNSLFIIDESSMLSASPNKDGALISDNSLLEDLFKHVKFHTPNNKIIFVGDSYQLPPIGYTGIAPALRKDFLEDNFTNKIKEFKLTKILRQDNESPILTIANSIKEKIDQVQNTFNLVTPVRYESYNLFISRFSELYNFNNPDDSIALGWSRKNVLKMNLDIRKKLYENKPGVFEIGDMLYLNSRNKSKSNDIQKGEIGKVIEILEEDGIKGNMLFHTLKIEFTDLNNKPYIIESKVLSDYAYSDTEYIPKEMFIKLAIERSKVNTKFKKSGDVLDDEYMSAMQVKFAYALTVHKAQGGEWKNVFLHAVTNWRDLRWNYTAVTRASKNIYSYLK